MSIYKNQEYPEKILHINNLRQSLEDLKRFQAEEKETFKAMIENDRQRTKAENYEIAKSITTKITSVNSIESNGFNYF